MTTADVATRLISLCRDGKFIDAVETLYADDIVSVEAMDYQGLGREMQGKDAVKRVSVAGPFVSPERFAVLYSFDWTRKAQN
jgi:SnoaL-like protein